MRWQEFKAVAHPPRYAAAEFDKGPIWRGLRWLGVRVAYIFFSLHVPADLVSLLAVLCGVTAVAGVIWSGVLPPSMGIIVAACCYSAVFLDFCDGPVARASGTSGPLGKILDGIGTDFLRESLLIALGVVAGSTVFLLAGILSGHFIVSVRNQFIWNGMGFDTTPNSGVVGRLVRAAFSVVVMLGLLPMLVAAASFGGFMRALSRGTLVFYLALCVVWFGNACFRAGKAQVRSSSQVEVG